MPGQFNPDKNLFSVAPVGHIVIVGHSAGLKTGLTRDRALNLIAWLVIATGATTEEIQTQIEDASKGGPSAIVPTVPALASVPKSVSAIRGKPISPELEAQIAQQMKSFVGEVDAEEKQALDAALAQEGGSNV